MPSISNSAHRTTGDDPGTGNSRPHHNTSGAVAAFHVMVQGAGVLQRHTDHLALGLFRCLADRLGHFLGLALAEAYATTLVADHDECCKAKALAALDGFRNAVDRDQTVSEFGRFLAGFLTTIAATAPVFTFCHIQTPQNFRPPSRAASAKALIFP
jgi:hypothetical protein